jgi:hypothetical protein
MIVTLDSVCAPSEDVVAREIEGEIIIVPLVSGIGDLEDELYTLNETGRAIWQKLDGSVTLEQVAATLCSDYSGDLAIVQRDVVGLVEELVRRRMLSVRASG